MTCIVGLISDEGVYMGSDSETSNGHSKRIVKNPKVFRNGDFLIGFTSSWRMGQLLQYEFVPPVICSETDLLEYMVTKFVPKIRSVFKESGFSNINNNVEEGGTFIVGVKGRLFRIEDNYQVEECVYPYTSCGNGYLAAFGSLFSTEGQPALERVEKALEAAAEFAVGVRAPFKIEFLEAK